MGRRKAGRKTLIISAAILTASVLLHVWDFSTNIRVDEAEGAYALSPDKRWKAEISGGYCKDNERDYAVVYLWDLAKYPSVSRGVYSRWGKKPEVKLVFPKRLQVRDGKCDVGWQSGTEFEIEYGLADGDDKAVEVLRYDVCTHEFRLERRIEESE